jgi:putative FmdB family regulatory protein
MPIYEYQCERCGVFEEMQRITDPALAKCPTCRRKVRRLISNTSFQLKGTGWYVTDYARGGSGGKKDGEKSSDTSSDGAKSEAKPAASDGKGDTKPKADSKSESKAASAGTSTTS